MDDMLIQRARAGDQTAFHSLVERYSTLVSRTARVLVADPLTAEEAVQDAWLDAWQHLSQFNCDRPLRPWLLTLVRNRCRMALWRRTLPSVSLHDIDAAHGALVADPAQVAIAHALHAELAVAIAHLSVDQQQVVALRFFADLELHEIALVTNTRIGTVKSRLHRAIVALRSDVTVDPAAGSIIVVQEDTHGYI